MNFSLIKRKIILPFFMVLCVNAFAHNSYECRTDTALKKLILTTCNEIQKEGLLDQLDPYIVTCYYLLCSDKEVEYDYLLDVAAMIHRSCGGSGCPSILKQINDKLCEILDFDFNNVFTAIAGNTEVACEKFEQTWTIIAGISEVMSVTFDFTDFSSVFTKIDAIEESLCDKFGQTWTILAAGCTPPTPISAPTTISSPGTYCLTADISGLITIAADRVVLDLNNHEISGASPSNIIIANHSDITIKNGRISGAGTNCIDTATCENIKILNIEFSDSPTALAVLTTTCIQIDKCTFRGFSSEALCFNNVNSSEVSNCSFFSNSGTRLIFVDTCNCINFVNLEMCNNFSSNELIGVVGSSSCGLNFFNCSFNGNRTTTASLTPPNLAGFSLTTCRAVIYNKCCVNSNIAEHIFIGLVFNDCKDVIIKTVDINSNSLLQGDPDTSLSAIAVNDIIAPSDSNSFLLEDIQINNNTTPQDARLIFFSGVNNINIRTATLQNNIFNGSSSQAINLGNVDNYVFDSIAIFNNRCVGGIFTGISLSSGNRGIVKNCSVSENLGGSDVEGLGATSSQDVQVVNCCFNDNIGSDAYGARIYSSSNDVIHIHCCSLRNTATAGTARGFFSEDSQEVIFDSCIANDNVGTDSGRGFDIRLTQTSSVIKCTAKRNQGTCGEGIHVENNCFDIVVKECIAIGNTGTVEGQGISILTSTMNVVQGNTCNDNTTNGILLNSTIKNVVLNNTCNNNGGIGLSLISSTSNLIKANFASYNSDGIVLSSSSNANCVFKNIVQANNATGISNTGLDNAFFKNKAQDNTTNFSGVAAAAIGVFSFGSGTYTFGPPNNYSNISVVP